MKDLEEEPLELVLGGGLVTSVMPLVKRSSLPTMPPAVRSMPLTTVLANADPGSVGRVTCLLPPPVWLGAERLPLPLRELRTAGTQGR